MQEGNTINNDESYNDRVEEVILNFFTLPRQISLLQSQSLLQLNGVNICISGGAIGADHLWNNLSTKYGHFCYIMSFETHHYTVPKLDSIWKRTKVIVLSSDELKQSNFILQKANLLLKRKSFNSDLIRRDYYQVKYAQSVYCIAPILSFENTQNYCVQLQGGTAWACQIFVMEHLKHVLFHTKYALPMYCYDLHTRQWYQCTIFQRQASLKLKWENIEHPPTPSGLYCAIGSRELAEVSISCIEPIFQIST